MAVLFLLKFTTSSFGLGCVKEQVVGSAPLHQTVHLISVGRLMPPCSKSNYCDVIGKCHYGVTEMGREAVVGVECAQQNWLLIWLLQGGHRIKGTLLKNVWETLQKIGNHCYSQLQSVHSHS